MVGPHAKREDRIYFAPAVIFPASTWAVGFDNDWRCPSYLLVVDGSAWRAKS